jgi:hypothetical protein
LTSRLVERPLGGIPAHPKEARLRCFNLFKEGKPCTDIAYETGISAGTIRVWASREKWREQMKIARANPEMDNETIVALAKQGEPLDLPEELAEQQALYQGNMSKAALVMSGRVAKMDGDEIVQKADKISKADIVARKALKMTEKTPFTFIQIGLLSQPQARTDSRQAALEDVTIDS